MIEKPSTPPNRVQVAQQVPKAPQKRKQEGADRLVGQFNQLAVQDRPVKRKLF